MGVGGGEESHGGQQSKISGYHHLPQHIIPVQWIGELDRNGPSHISQNESVKGMFETRKNVQDCKHKGPGCCDPASITTCRL